MTAKIIRLWELWIHPKKGQDRLRRQVLKDLGAGLVLIVASCLKDVVQH